MLRRQIFAIACLAATLASGAAARPGWGDDWRSRPRGGDHQVDDVADTIPHQSAGLLVPAIQEVRSSSQSRKIELEPVLITSFQISAASGEGSVEPIVTLEYLLLATTRATCVEVIGADELGIYVEDEHGVVSYILML